FRGRIFGAGLRHIVNACLSIGTLNDQFYEGVGIPASRRFLVPYVVDNDRLQAASDSISKDEARRRIGVRSDGPVVLFCGKLIPVKQPLRILEAFAATAPSHASLVFAGSGLLESELRRAAQSQGKERVIFL